MIFIAHFCGSKMFQNEYTNTAYFLPVVHWLRIVFYVFRSLKTFSVSQIKTVKHGRSVWACTIFVISLDLFNYDNCD